MVLHFNNSVFYKNKLIILIKLNHVSLSKKSRVGVPHKIFISFYSFFFYNFSFIAIFRSILLLIFIFLDLVVYSKSRYKEIGVKGKWEVPKGLERISQFRSSTGVRGKNMGDPTILRFWYLSFRSVICKNFAWRRQKHSFSIETGIKNNKLKPIIYTLLKFFRHAPNRKSKKLSDTGKFKIVKV